MNFDQAFEKLIGHEGAYVHHPSDPGGRTKFGITEKTYPNEDIRGLTLERAKFLYYRDFWCKAGCDLVPERVKFDLFDAAVNSGVDFAVKALQVAVGASPDGDIGPKTLAAVQQAPTESLLMRLTGARLQLMADHHAWPAFGRGWARRLAKNLLEA